ncbi:hypothetical protein G6011_07842 [Alternaria panax]|uniref:Uncharacterized protein n=1 Tax=Alternaria panax TaxID=48097 RepID=A0AAD4FAS9_9PLEO|nr:hypothetical protein G6011_07842 [Alternaria panax]
MRGGWTSSELIRSSRGTAQGNGSRKYNPFLASKAMKLKLSGQVSREISERRQVGDAADMFADKASSEGEKPWWRNVGMEEDVWLRALVGLSALACSRIFDGKYHALGFEKAWAWQCNTIRRLADAMDDLETTENKTRE